ncbi:helix-turn-helix domain-containing protein [Pseudomonas serboccidentalis]|uniref:Helix-turn-helix domain-containing protein n=1 Tax=Pseudomonas serboccidentalis TaxID=2964670 RepID=A0ABY7ZD07_9PSED|nr:helix-turn-helix domain-containing protein [Pseudomonas serboccidentalis]WDR37619.1 helix-turn-helix domain-containing protein [Pseudomonas serboccidentalis]
MDSLINAAGRALAAGDPLAALKLVALREDPPALALRGIAMAQLGDLSRARALLQRGVKAFGANEPLSRARCVVAEAEVALATRDLGWPVKALEAARRVLLDHADHLNAAHARYLQIRRLLLIGQLDAAQALLAELDPAPWPPSLRAVHELLTAGIALRQVQAHTARAALERAQRAAQQAAIPALTAEIEHALQMLDAPAARLIISGQSQTVTLAQVEALLASSTLVVDACRYSVRGAGMTVALATRPVLFSLLRMLAQAWPADVPRDALIAQAFRLKLSDDSHRARLRVEIGRLRSALQPLARIVATARGFALAADDVALLTLPVEDKHAALLALLADGEAWSSSALALALGSSQRQVQRSLEALALAEKVQWFGVGRARRWTTPPVPGFATILLLPVALGNG